MDEAVLICRALPEDAEVIFGLIRQLAIYEEEPNAVLCSVDDLRQQLASQNPPFQCLLAKQNGKDVGFALYFFSYSTWRGRPCLYLEDLFVLDEHRRKGAGLKLMQALAQEALHKDCPRMEWSVLNWNQLAIDFYRKLGAIAMDEWTRYRLEEAQITALIEREK